MYSLVIAEDELTTRRGLVHMVKWNEIGFQVNAEFSDGQELLAYLKTSMPDVILTDIKMSRVSGLDIARFAAEQNLPVQIVFLSGYKDFEYAQSAVEYHVLHYLVKPVSIPRLREVFTGVRELLDQQNALQNAMLNRVDHYQKLVNYQKQQFILDALSGSLRDDREAEERLKIVNISPRQSSRGFVVFIKNSNGFEYNGFLWGFCRIMDGRSFKNKSQVFCRDWTDCLNFIRLSGKSRKQKRAFVELVCSGKKMRKKNRLRSGN